MLMRVGWSAMVARTAPSEGMLSETVRHQTGGWGTSKAGSAVTPSMMHCVADVEPGPLQDACPTLARLGEPKCRGWGFHGNDC